MYALDNKTGVAVMPEIKAQYKTAADTLWFTEGGNGLSPTIPGADWFNITQAELLNVLKEANITPVKSELNQIAKAIRAIAQNEADKKSIASASLTQAGKVQLSNAIDSNNETTAATSKALKTAYEKLTKVINTTTKAKLNMFVGIPVPYPIASVPEGFLAMAGQRFDKSMYPVLAERYPSGTLPDLRGEFIRGWDAGRNVDNNRTLLTSQMESVNVSDLVARITFFTPNHTGGSSNTFVVTHGTAHGINGGRDRYGYTANQYDAPVIKKSSNIDETRPRNIAFQYICLAA